VSKRHAWEGKREKKFKIKRKEWLGSGREGKGERVGMLRGGMEMSAFSKT
jgi:hypothetical protein